MTESDPNTTDEIEHAHRTSLHSKNGWRENLRRVIFEADTTAGKLFDIGLLLAILCSILVVSLSTLQGITEKQLLLLQKIEWIVTILFTIEYVLRLICVENPKKYAKSFYGIIDLISILPSYIAILFPLAPNFAIVRSLRLLRVFRVLKLVNLLSESEVLYKAFWDARSKIVVFFATVLVVITIMGTLMYEVEHHQEDSGFTSIPQSMYWAIVTMTTVGYGDIVPETTAGKFLSAILILLGYSLIIVPTGFVSANLARTNKIYISTRTCKHCITEGHDIDAKYCKYCGEEM